MAIPLLDAIDIEGRDVSADALLTQREPAEYLVTKRKAHYHFTVKGNQAGVLQDLDLFFRNRKQPQFIENAPPDHGRIETRKIWTTTELNNYLNFPHVGQAFVIERHSIEKKTGESSLDIAYGITSRTPEQADPRQVLKVNREHWTIENSCHYIIDWNYDEDRSRIRKGYGPENITRLRRFAIGVIKSKGVRSVAQKMRQLTRNTRFFLQLAQNPFLNPQYGYRILLHSIKGQIQNGSLHITSYQKPIRRLDGRIPKQNWQLIPTILI